MKIWAHRGCSQNYPENTLTSFGKAAELSHLAGVELDIQLTHDERLVVIHDERVDRTTNGIGFVRDFTLKELKNLAIYTGNEKVERIPTMAEVFDLLNDRKSEDANFKINIELKNSVYYYESMEEKILNLAAKTGWENNIVYSSFYTKSVVKVHKLLPKADIAILGSHASDCLYKAKGLGVTKIHPYWQHLDVSSQELAGYTVRAWFDGHLFPEKPTGGRLNFAVLEAKGITDVMINEPEVYDD